MSEFGQFFHVPYKSCFLNVTDDCVVFRASYPSCQIVKAIIPHRLLVWLFSIARGRILHFPVNFCSKKDIPAWQWEILLSVIPFPPSKGDPEIPTLKAKLLQWIFCLKYVNFYECSKGLVTQEFFSVFRFMRGKYSCRQRVAERVLDLLLQFFCFMAYGSCN